MSKDDEERTPRQPLSRGRPALKAKNRWNEYAKRGIQGAMSGEGVSYKRLAKLLLEDDPASEETAESLLRRVNRGTFPYAFALRVFAVLGIKNLDISRIQTDADVREAAAKRKK